MNQFQERNVALAIVLTIITCGIYGLYWIAVLHEDSKLAAHDDDGTSGVLVVVLSIVTCSIYLFYWAYKMGERMNKAKQMRKIPFDTSTPILYIILAIFGLNIVNLALIQSDLNNFNNYTPSNSYVTD